MENKTKHTFPSYLCQMLNGEHLLIGGTTGSGKSVMINNLLCRLSANSPQDVQTVLIDPKGCELYDWQDNHCIGYADTADKITRLMRSVSVLMSDRFAMMRRRNVRLWQGAKVKIIIDEYAFIRLSCRDAERSISDIAYRGRAAGLQIIAATQRPTRDIIGGIIAANFAQQLALRTRTAQESRNIIGVDGAEHLPLYGTGLWYSPLSGLQTISIPLISSEISDAVKKMWNNVEFS